MRWCPISKIDQRCIDLIGHRRLVVTNNCNGPEILGHWAAPIYREPSDIIEEGVWTHFMVLDEWEANAG